MPTVAPMLQAALHVHMGLDELAPCDPDRIFESALDVFIHGLVVTHDPAGLPPQAPRRGLGRRRRRRRRLGRSLGINHVPPKVCTYSCAYCQVGQTNRLEAVHDAGDTIDYVTFVPGVVVATLGRGA